VPTNPAQVASNRRHFATIGVTVPTKPAKSICIRGDDNIGRMSDAQHTRACQSAGISVTRPKGIAVPCQQLVVLLRGLVNTQPHPTTPG